jgi:hypothetical protein
MTVKLALTCAIALSCALGAGLSATSASASRKALEMLDQLDAGGWEMRLRDEPGRPVRMCLGDARQFIQLRHRELNCTRVVVDDTDNEITVQYTCHGQGYGRTHIRRETGSLIQIDTQGIAQGLPFSFSAEARRVGACGT